MTAEAIKYPEVEGASDLEWTHEDSSTAKEQGWTLKGSSPARPISLDKTRLPQNRVWQHLAERADAGNTVAARALAIVCGVRARWAHELSGLDGAVPIVVDMEDLEEAFSRGWEIVNTQRGLRVSRRAEGSRRTLVGLKLDVSAKQPATLIVPDGPSWG